MEKAEPNDLVQPPKESFMVRFVRWLDPKLEKFRPEKEPEEPEPPEPYIPESVEDVVWLLKKTPLSVLSEKERGIIAAAMQFPSKRVKDLMLPRAEITFVHKNDFMGPLMLDKLYKSGLSHFPVLGAGGKVEGVLHTASLNSLEIKETERCAEYLDPRVYYMREDYTLEQAFAAFLRTNCHFFMVVNRDGLTTGLITYKMLAAYLLGEVPEDDFHYDDDVMLVAKR